MCLLTLMRVCQVMEILRNMYRAFDHIAELTGVYKIETIGDAYFAVATLHDMSITAEESCYRMAVFALAVREFMRGPFGKIYDIDVRVGMHTGDLVAGVLGDLRPRYVLVGDTVNTASRMETSAEPDMINVSETSAALLQKYFTLTKRPLAAVKGKGKMQMYELGDFLLDECPFGLMSPGQLSLLALQQVVLMEELSPNKSRMRGDSARRLCASVAEECGSENRRSDAPAGPGERSEVMCS